MSLEICKLCDQEAKPWVHINGHICQDCYANAKFIWISVKDRLPEKDGRYLVVEDHHYKWVGVCSMRNGKFDYPVKYWMPIPEAPKEVC